MLWTAPSAGAHGEFRGLSARPETWKTMVRPGIPLYGYSLALMRGGKHTSRGTDAVASCAFLEDAGADRERSRGRTSSWLYGQLRHQGTSRIAVVPVGYADGYPRLLSNRARVIVWGEFAPVVGRVSMDLTIVDVSHIPGVTVGDEVILIGTQ